MFGVGEIQQVSLIEDDDMGEKTINRKELNSKLRNLIQESKIRNIIGVDVYSSSNLDVLGYAWVGSFAGKKMKDNLFCFLMDKSLTSRIVDVQPVRILGLLSLRIILFSQGEKPLKRTNIDGKTMRLLGRARYVYDKR